MRVLHVVTLISPDNAYGGPLRVALNLAAGARALGHEATVAAAFRGFAEAPTALDGVPLRLFRARVLPGIGHAGVSSPGLLRWLWGAARGFDAVHVHFGRDLVGVPSALLVALRGVPLVLQPHGMVDASENPLAALLDRVAVRRILRNADRIAVLTDREEADLAEVAGPGLRVVRLPNGVPLPPRAADPGASEEVLFLSRLHARKRPQVFVELAAEVAPDAPRATFRLVGPDEGELPGVLAAIDRLGLEGTVAYEGALPPAATAARLRDAACLVLPSVAEVFPMAVLEALAAGVPVVMGRSSGIAPLVEAAGAGAVVDDDVHSYAGAVRALLEDPELRRTAGRNGRELAARAFSMPAVAGEAVEIYRTARARP